MKVGNAVTRATRNLKQSLARAAGVAALASAALLGSVVATPAQAQEKMQLTVAEAIRWIGFLPLYVANDKGFFARENLDVKIVTAGGRALAVQTVISGQADLSSQDPAGPTQALKQGADIRIFLPLINRNLIYMVGPKGAAEGDKLDPRGMRIAVATPPSSPHNVLTHFLREKGFEEVDRATWRPKGSTNPKDQVRLMFVGFFQELPPVSAGQADAAVVLTPYEAIGVHDVGLKVLYSWAEASGPFALTVFSASQERLKSKQPAFQAFTNAMTRAYEWMYANPGETADIATKYFPKLNPVVVKEAAGRMLREGAVPRNGIVPKDGYQANIFGLAARAGDPGANVPYEQAVVTEFGERAMKGAAK